ncbi:MAG: hypothetical protein ACT4NX_08115 [Deltaproteobacteria bacterium]
MNTLFPILIIALGVSAAALISSCYLPTVPAAKRIEILEARVLNTSEEDWWAETLGCLADEGKISPGAAVVLQKPVIHIAREDSFTVKGRETSSFSSRCNLYFSKRLDGNPRNSFVWKHEFTHCIEFQVKGKTGHSSDWWFTNALGLRASICQ